MTTENAKTIRWRVSSLVISFFLCIFIIWLAYALRIMIIDLILAVTVASAIAPAAESAEKRKIPRWLSVLVIYFVVIMFYSFMGYLVSGPVQEQAALFKEHIPQYATQINETYDKILQFFGEPPAAEVPPPANQPAQPVGTGTLGPIDELKQKLVGDSTPISLQAHDLRNIGVSLVRRTFDVTAGLAGFVAHFVFVLFMAGYFVIEAKNIWKELLRWIPPENRDRAASLIAPLGSRMGGYVRGQILVSTAVATFFAVGLTLIGVKYGVMIGLLAGFLNLLPFVGSAIAATLAILVAASQSPTMVGLTLLLFVAEQTVESNFIVPHLLGRQVDLHPLIVLFAIVIGATLAGALGAIVAVPLASAALFLAKEFYVKPLNQGVAEVD